MRMLRVVPGYDSLNRRYSLGDHSLRLVLDRDLDFLIPQPWEQAQLDCLPVTLALLAVWGNMSIRMCLNMNDVLLVEFKISFIFLFHFHQRAQRLAGVMERTIPVQ